MQYHILVKTLFYQTIAVFWPKIPLKILLRQKLATELVLGFLQTSNSRSHVVFDEESKTGLGFEIEHREQMFRRKSNLQLTVNPVAFFPYTRQ